MTERSDMDLPDGGKSYKLVAEGAESTVVAEYEPSHGRETAYQSEADLEEELLRILESQGYERLSAHTESELIANLRTQLLPWGHRLFDGGHRGQDQADPGRQHPDSEP